MNLASSSWKLCRCGVVTQAARVLSDAALAVLVAPVCAVCCEPLESPTQGAVCGRCWTAVETFRPPCCVACGDALLSWRAVTLEERTCPRCRRAPPLVTVAAGIGPYQGTLQAIVQAVKYDGRTSLAGPLADLMRASGSHILHGADAVVPVPLHRSRRRQRGFNQAAELARYLGPPVLHALSRSRRTPPQVDLPAARRHANVRGAFSVRAGTEIRGLTLVLVDDVSTTGATLDACARPLLDAGAAAVRGLTAAKTVSR